MKKIFAIAATAVALSALAGCYIGKADLDNIWPALIGDDVHPHDFGYGVEV